MVVLAGYLLVRMSGVYLADPRILGLFPCALPTVVKRGARNAPLFSSHSPQAALVDVAVDLTRPAAAQARFFFLSFLLLPLSFFSSLFFLSPPFPLFSDFFFAAGSRPGSAAKRGV